MSKPWGGDKFKKLERKWNDKLAKSGFIDAEVTIDGERKLKQYACNIFERSNTKKEYISQKMLYYELLTQHAFHHKFTNQTDKIIMELASNGARPIEIVKRLKKIGKKIHRHTVRFIIRRYEHLWKIKFWTRDKMYRKAHTK